MPEIWLNYGNNDVVLDILAENLEERPVFESNNLDDSKINERLESLDLSKPIEIALLNYTDSPPVSYTHMTLPPILLV